MVISLSKRTDFSLLVQSTRLTTLSVHWFGRTLICPGPDLCPACHCARPKRYHYIVATIAKKLEVVELCDSLGRTFVELASTFPGCSLRGFWALGARRTVRSIWDIDKLGYSPDFVKEVRDSVLINGVSSLYQLPFGKSDETIPTWLERVNCCHVPLLTKCVLPV